MNIWVLLYKFAWIVVMVVCVIGVVCVFIPKAHSYRELQKRKIALEENNARMEARARQLETNQQRFRSDPDFIERIAREQGRAKPGETIFRFPATNTTAVVTNKP